MGIWYVRVQKARSWYDDHRGLILQPNQTGNHPGPRGGVFANTARSRTMTTSLDSPPDPLRYLICKTGQQKKLDQCIDLLWVWSVRHVNVRGLLVVIARAFALVSARSR